MKLKTYQAWTMAEALAFVKTDLGADEVFDVLQGEHVALGAVFGAAAGLDGRGFLGRVHPGLRTVDADDAGDFVAADGNPLAAFHDADGVDEVIHLRFPEDGLKDAACGGGRHDGSADALPRHLGPSEAGEIAPNAERDEI